MFCPSQQPSMKMIEAQEEWKFPVAPIFNGYEFILNNASSTYPRKLFEKILKGKRGLKVYCMCYIFQLISELVLYSTPSILTLHKQLSKKISGAKGGKTGSC